MALECAWCNGNGKDCCKAQDSHTIFVFGSNLAGIHGAGAALYAFKNKGAIYGRGEGFQGQSYALPTKDYYIRTLPLTAIEQNVGSFIRCAQDYMPGGIVRHGLTFAVTKIGCGLAGYTEDQIKPLFKNAPENCILPPGWRE